MIVPRGSPTKLAGGRIINRPARGFRAWGRPGMPWRGSGLGYVSPVGFPDFASFQTAVIASFPSCPPPFDPTCENPRDAQIASNLLEWKTNPGSCGVIVCDAAGNAAPGSTTSGSPASGSSMPVHTSRGFQNPVGPGFISTAAPPVKFGYWAGGGTKPPAGTPVGSPRVPRQTIPMQSASTDGAPGGTSAPPAAPTPVQTQTPPCDPTSDPTCPGYQTPTGTAISNVISAIPWWGWGIGVLALVMIARPGGRR